MLYVSTWSPFVYDVPCQMSDINTSETKTVKKIKKLLHVHECNMQLLVKKSLKWDELVEVNLARWLTWIYNQKSRLFHV